MNKDGDITISDVTALVNVATGKSSVEVIKAYEVDNSSIIGTWYSSDGTVLNFDSDGTTYYQGEATYEFFPLLRHLLIFNASGKIIKTMTFKEVTPQYLLEESLINGELTYYTKSTCLVTGITLDQSSLSLNAGITAQLTATVTPSTALNTNLAWTSDNENIATVDQTGLVTAKRSGTCSITCTANDGSGVSASCVVTVVASGSGNTDEHEYVDLGLPSGTLWATCNIGADNPEDYGNYFAWGETVPYGGEDTSNAHNYATTGSYTKTTFSWGTYKYCSGTSYKTLTKYCNDSSYGYNGFTDTLTELEETDDAAYVNWGSNWRMPSKDQRDELRTECTWTWTTRNGVNGWEVVGPNGKSIFLPATGYYNDFSLLESTGSAGFYWSRTLDLIEPCCAHILNFNSDNIYTTQEYHIGGHSIRPVRASETLVQVTSISLNHTSLYLTTGHSQTLTATVLPWYATNKNVSWYCSDESVATVDQTGMVTAVGTGTCTITSAATDSSGVTASCTVNVNMHEYVDLGLPSGTMWATCNIGAEYPEDYGDYFAWGETTGYNEGKTSFYWGTYQWCNGSTSSTFTKYCQDSSRGYNGFTDTLTELELEDDAANVIWGSQWRMPSFDQFEELYNSIYTTTTWTTQNGVKGKLITSNSNGNSIFLPAAGYRDDETCHLVPPYGHYWSRTLGLPYPYMAYLLYFSQGGILTSESYRCQGSSIRPVHNVDFVQVMNIMLSPTSLSLTTGNSKMLSATIQPSDATDRNLTWTSSDENVATVDQTGVVTAIGVGSCTITCAATDGSGVSASCILTVVASGSGNTNGHEYVDLGLPSGTLWSTCNIGADNPEDYGDYFAWGETTGYNDGKTTFNWSTYQWCNGSNSTLTKYCSNSSYGDNGFTDTLTELELEDDAAYVNWGNEWLMPSNEQFAELINSSYTTTTWKTQNGVNGRLITSNSNGNSIFLPAAGYRNETSIGNVGTYGYYRSRTLHTSYPYYAYGLSFYSGSIYTNSNYRFYGHCVRPVRNSDENSIVVTSITFSQTSLSLTTGNSQTLTATVLPSNATNNNLTWTSSNASIATVDQTGVVTAKRSGTCTITAKAVDGSDVSASCVVTVIFVDHSGSIGGRAYVDLGLPSGTLWATCNIGADNPEDYGDYFAWGETTGYNDGKTNFSWSTYQWCNGTENTLTKYCQNSSKGYNGFTDTLMELENADDAAYFNWGSQWRMPSLDQFRELINGNYTTAEWTTQNGVYGRKITSKMAGYTDNSIFLPAAGMRSGTGFNNPNSYGGYWSRSLRTGDPRLSYLLHLVDSGYVYWADFFREDGRSIRPVRNSDENLITVTSIILSQTTLSLTTGNSQTLTATVLPSDATNKNVSWSSSDENVATVDQTGIVTAVGTGTCTITCAATDGSGVSATCNVSVTQLVTGITLSQSFLSLNTGNSQTLTATVQPSNATNKNVSWSSSDENVTMVDQTGVVTAVGIGACSIICTATDGSDVSATCSVTVTQLVTGITLSHSSLSLNTGNSQTLTATVQPSDATNKNVSWSSSDENVATVDQTGIVTAVGTGTCTITCAATDGSGMTATCTVTVIVDHSGSIGGRAYVDLGLPSGTLWATCNIGATNPEDYGDYFAWGETTGYNDGKTDFSWSTYQWCNGTEKTMTKYCNNSSYGNNGFTDALTELEPEDDAAYVNWGSQWRMPSKTQLIELINKNYTITEWTTQNNVYGWKVTSKRNGNSIFLPVAGYRKDTLLNDEGLKGFYWSRTLYTTIPHSSSYLSIKSSEISTYINYTRYCGLSVRPVRRSDEVQE